jgi:hypothetical protein
MVSDNATGIQPIDFGEVIFGVRSLDFSLAADLRQLFYDMIMITGLLSTDLGRQALLLLV